MPVTRLTRTMLIAAVPAAALIAATVVASLPAAAQKAIAFPGAATRAAGLNDTQTGPNWAGYVASGTKFRYIKATFTVPRANCGRTRGTEQKPAMAADWVGLDGYNENNATVEQDGVTAICIGGGASYQAWYEMFPKPPVYPNIIIRAGDTIAADVFFDQKKHAYRLDLSDVSDGQGFSIWKRCPVSYCQNVSAEVITESPAMSAAANTKYYPLADFGASTFWHIGITSMAGQKGGFGSGIWNATRLMMADSSGRTKAWTTNLSAGGTAFRTYWKNAT